MDEQDDNKATGDGNAPQQVLDVKGLNCPLPVLRAKIALGKLAPGQRLRVLATDPYSVMDFEAFCNKTGHRLIDQREEQGTFIFDLQRHDEPT